MCQTPVKPLHRLSGQTSLPEESEPQHMTNCVPFAIVGSRTQINDVPFGFHVSISNGRPLLDMSTKAMSAPVALDCRSS